MPFGGALVDPQHDHVGSDPPDRACPVVSGAGDNSILIAGENHVVDQSMLTGGQVWGHGDVVSGVGRSRLLVVLARW